MKRNLGVACIVMGLALISGCSSLGHVGGSVANHVRSAASHVAPVAKPVNAAPASGPSCRGTSTVHRYVGYSVTGFPSDESHLDAVEQATGIGANVASFYIPLGAKLNVHAISSICSQGIFPLIEIDTDKIPLQDVVDGREDAVLSSYALALGTLQIHVAIDFDHEFNGPWWDWGYTHTNPSEFVAAWRHIVTLFRRDGATNAIWIWNPNVSSSATAALQPWYPGDAYVTWVGLDGYFYSRSDTYSSVFNPTIEQIRMFTSRPLFIVETGANPRSGRTRAIASLFRGAAATPSLLGLIWFDYDKYTTHDWLIDHDPLAVAAFRTNARSYLNGAK